MPAIAAGIILTNHHCHLRRRRRRRRRRFRRHRRCRRLELMSSSDHESMKTLLRLNLYKTAI